MSQVFFSTSSLTPGASVSFTLPTENSDGTGSRDFGVRWFRDSGALASDGVTLDINQDAVLLFSQNSFTLLIINNSDVHDGWGAAILSPSPAGGAVTVTNLGPGSIGNLSVGDYDAR